MTLPLPTSTHRIRVPIASIDASDRIRSDYSHLDELKDSISREGLIQPIVITLDNRLVAGGSRLRACAELGWTEIDITYVEALPEDKLRILEVEENIRRKDFDWRERVGAVARIHQLTERQKILSKESSGWTMRQTGELLGVSLGHVSYCIALAAALVKKDKEVEEATTMREALNILLERKEKEANALLAKQTILSSNRQGAARSLQREIADEDIFSTAPARPPGPAFVGGEGIGRPTQVFLPNGLPASQPLPTNIPNESLVREAVSRVCFQGDCLQLMSSMSPESVDHIITDIPYGIDMDMLSQQNTGMDVSTVSKEHDVEENWDLMRAFVPAAFRVLRPNSYCILWYDLSMHYELTLAAESAGFKIQRWPLLWIKTSPCLNQAAQFNFTKAAETAMVLRKGNATLVSPQSKNWWMGDREAGFDHPFAKPTKLWQWIMKAVAIKGQTIYDPFAGVGSSTLAALESGFIPLASELNTNHFSRLVENVRAYYQTALCLPNTTKQSESQTTNANIPSSSPKMAESSPAS